MKYLCIVLFGMLIGSAYANDTQFKFSRCDTEQCVKHFKEYKRYSRSHIDAAALLGDMYYHGYGTEVDHEQALRYYKRAARWGSLIGRYQAGLLLVESDDTDDVEKGVGYLSDAAKRGLGKAGYALAEVLSDPKFGINDLEQADTWAARVIQQGHDNASRLIANLERRGQLSVDAMPLTSAAISNFVPVVLAANPVEPSAQEDNAHEASDIEVVEVKGILLSVILEYGLNRFKNLPPDIRNQSTGTRLKGRTCEAINNCGTVNLDEWSRYVSYSLRW